MPHTPQQQDAISCVDRNLQIIACAGSGKTRVLAARTVEILRQDGVTPRNIVAFTFTDKAAAELKERIATMVAAQLGNVHGLATMYVGTIHGWCLQFLQTYLFRFLKYSVLNDVQTRLLAARNSKKSGLTDVEVISGPSRGQKLTRGARDVRVFLESLNVLREDDVDVSQLPAGLSEAWVKYNDVLDTHRYLDYSEILVQAASALLDTNDPDCVRAQEQIAERIGYLIVDEYQDVNPIQEALVRRMHQLGANVCVVGDDDQTIYQWRGSEIRKIIEFQQRYPSVHPVTLAENFRSSPGVVDPTRGIAELNDPNRLPKSMVAAGHQIYEPGDVLALSFNSPDAEAAWIKDKVLAMRGIPFQDDPDSLPRGLSWSDCAVLLRVWNTAEAIVDAFRTAGIPFIIAGFGNLFQADEVRAAVALFEYMVGQITSDDVRQRWLSANLGLSASDLDAGIAVLNSSRSWQTGQRWSAYNIQRTFLNFLEAVNLREERVPPTTTGAARGEVVYFNLGKFSRVISDFEQIHFQSEPQQKYESFVWWLQHDAPDYYDEGGADAGFAQPDAVQIMTIHQAKGMEWPVAFVPALQRNRFPSTTGGRGRNKWHIMPKQAVPDADRYDGSVEDERRLFYVAITRSKKHLFCSFAPTPGNQLYQKQSQFFRELTQSPRVLTREPSRAWPAKVDPRPKRQTPNVVLSFSQLKYFFECPYQFKLRFLYGFNPPLHEALGFGKSLHDALAEVHKRAIAGDLVDESEAERLIDQHQHTPFAYPALRDQLRASAIEAVRRYLRQNSATLNQSLHSEQQVEIQVAPGITVNGRIDLIKRIDTGEVSIVDFKSSERAQAEDVTRFQLHTYAMGYRDLTGTDADLIEIHNLDAGGSNVREMVDPALIQETEQRIRTAGHSLRKNQLPRLSSWCTTCAGCDYAGICRSRTNA